MIDRLPAYWRKHFGATKPEVIIRAPGRINIIGEHTDYNEGWVMPGAIAQSVYIMIARSDGPHHHWVAADVDDEIRLDSSHDPRALPLWAKYILGALAFKEITGSLNIYIGGDLPVGAGVSSSSSLVCGLFYGLQEMFGGTSSREELALLAARVEREVIGLQGGIMDQFAIMMGKEHHVMMLDCRTRMHQHIQAEIPGCRWLLINTKVKHQLIDSDYNSRADECRQAVDIICKVFPEVRSLRDVDKEMLSHVHLSETLLKRVTFVIEENRRVHEMRDALKNMDPNHAGDLLKGSHHGLRYEYEVSCAELDHLADFANRDSRVYGARMMGGGFGGCVICFAKEKDVDTFEQDVIKSYSDQFGFSPDIIEFILHDGVEDITSSVFFK